MDNRLIYRAVAFWAMLVLAQAALRAQSPLANAVTSR